MTPPSQWRPISEAPKETDVLLWIDGRPPVVAGLFRDQWETFDGKTIYETPECWAPIEPPPLEQQEPK